MSEPAKETTQSPFLIAVVQFTVRTFTPELPVSSNKGIFKHNSQGIHTVIWPRWHCLCLISFSTHLAPGQQGCPNLNISSKYLYKSSNRALIPQHHLKQAAITCKSIPLASGIHFIDKEFEFLSHMLKIFSHGSICSFHTVQLLLGWLLTPNLKQADDEIKQTIRTG